MSYSIQKLEGSDWETLKTIRLRALQSDPAVFGSNYDKEARKTPAEWQEWVSRDDMAVFVLYSPDGDPVGMTGILVDRNDSTGTSANLWGSWIAPEARGKGLSAKLYKARIDWAKRHSTIEKITVSHRATNEFSKRANQKHGFRFSHSKEKTWPDGTSEDEVFYLLTL